MSMYKVFSRLLRRPAALLLAAVLMPAMQVCGADTDSVCGLLRDCDLLFQVSPGGNAITAVTSGTAGLQIEHVGIFARIGGRAVVIEAVPSRGVCVTPADSFMLRTDRASRPLPLVVGRVTGGLDAAASLARALSFVGCAYDRLYLADNDMIYCSELVQKSFADSAGRPVFATIPMTFRDSAGHIPAYWQRFYARHGMPVPEGWPGTNPGELSRRRNVEIVAGPLTASRSPVSSR